MSAANPNPMEKSKVLVLVVENAGGGRRCHRIVPMPRIRRRVVLLGLVASKNHSGPGYKYSRFFVSQSLLTRSVSCDVTWGYSGPKPVVDRKLSPPILG
jgi:hypothetical protein